MAVWIPISSPSALKHVELQGASISRLPLKKQINALYPACGLFVLNPGDVIQVKVTGYELVYMYMYTCWTASHSRNRNTQLLVLPLSNRGRGCYPHI
ncbi:hypothetical protein PoB_001204900 [Plakobranchus ocellatus]|uniref:Uncharacterized protein n=1 Tax=Plakobranchus ocellatus TaxID=259542 RepID=A0AAV3YR68_9GAST|nr:hypothetical protein PoB_001204900 [Plakobranchus ocellatus]